MANISTSNEIKPITLDKFLGLNLKGDMQLKLGESSDMYDCYIDNNYKLKKMFGYRLYDYMYFSGEPDTPIRAIWYGKIGSSNNFIVVCDGHVWRLNNIGNLNYQDITTWHYQQVLAFGTDLGTLTDGMTTIFAFNDNLYFVSGSEYKKWDGTNEADTLTDVTGYVPKILISCTPSTGAGTDYENINLLTGSKHATYNGDGTATYHLPETSITSVDSVYVNGVLKTVTTHYTVNATTGVVTFTGGNEPVTGLDNVDIYWTKGTGSRGEVYKNKGSILFGQSNDTRVFLFGNTDAQNRITYSGLANGTPSAEYFPANGYNDIGSSNTAITDIQRQYDRMIIYKENETYYSVYESFDLNGETIVNFPSYPLNQAVGNKAFGQGQIINNNPVSIDNGIWEWVSTNVRDERNAQLISDRIDSSLTNLDLTSAITIDWQAKTQYLIAVNKTIYIYNYTTDTFSKLTIDNNVSCFFIVEDELWMGDSVSGLYKFSEDFAQYNEKYDNSNSVWAGTDIDMYWEMGFYDFGASYLRKNMQNIWLSILPQARTSATVGYITDKETSTNNPSISFQAVLFDDVDFTDFSFEVPTNVKPYRIKLKAKKFTYLKLTITNNSSTDTLTVLEINIKTEYSGESK